MREIEWKKNTEEEIERKIVREMGIVLSFVHVHGQTYTRASCTRKTF